MKFKNFLRALTYPTIVLAIFVIYLLLVNQALTNLVGKGVTFPMALLYTTWFVASYIGYHTRSLLTGFVPVAVSLVLTPSLAGTFSPENTNTGLIVTLAIIIVFAMIFGYLTAQLIDGLKKPPDTQ